MPLPETGPATVDGVKLQLSLAGDDELDDVYIAMIVDAVNVVVRALPIVVDDLAGNDGEWNPRVSTGATILAGRLVRRRNSPSGVAALTDAGIAYVPRNDPDVAQLLQLGAFIRPEVG